MISGPMKSATRRKTPSKKQTARVYNNRARSDASAKNREAIILALVDLLAENSGGDVGIAEIAKRSKISQRTLFRFFKDKSALIEATRDYVGRYLIDANKHLQDLDLPSFSKLIFGEFDREPKLTMAYVLSPFGQTARTLMRKSLNKTLIARFVKDYGVKVSAKNERKISFIVSLLNARVWYEMKTDFGMTGAESGEILTWAINTLARDLQRASPGTPRAK